MLNVKQAKTLTASVPKIIEEKTYRARDHILATKGSKGSKESLPFVANLVVGLYYCCLWASGVEAGLTRFQVVEEEKNEA